MTTAVAAVVASIWPEVESLVGSAAERSGEGTLVLVLLVVIGALAAAAQWFTTRADDGESVGSGAPLRAPLATVLAAVAILVVAIPLSAAGINAVAPGAGDEVAARNTSAFGSNRYEYWQVAADAFASDPIRGTGAELVPHRVGA